VISGSEQPLFLDDGKLYAVWGNAIWRNQLVEVLGDELGSVVGNDPRLNAGVPRFGPFQNDLNVGLGHRFPQIPMENERACSKCQGPITLSMYYLRLQNGLSVPSISISYKLLSPFHDGNHNSGHRKIGCVY
jgi:hypothetical protein